MIPFARRTLNELKPLVTARFTEDLALLGGGSPPEITVQEGQTEIFGLTAADQAEPGALCFVTNTTYLAQAMAGQAAAVVVDPSLKTPLGSYPALIAKDPRLVFAAILSLAKEKVSPPLATGEPFFLDRASCEIGPSVVFGPRCYIGARVKLGEGVVVGPDVFIEDDVTIGPFSILHPKAIIRWGCRLGARCQIHAGAVIGEDGFGYVQVPDPKTGRLIHYKNAHLGRVVVGDDVEIGALTAIDRGLVADTVVGRGVKMDNLIQIGHNCQIGQDVIVVAQAGLGGHSQVGDRVFLLGQCGLTHGAVVGQDAIVTGQSGVIGTIPAGRSTWSGTPARAHSKDLRGQAMVARDLPKWRRFWQKFRQNQTYDDLKDALKDDE